MNFFPDPYSLRFVLPTGIRYSGEALNPQFSACTFWVLRRYGATVRLCVSLRAPISRRSRWSGPWYVLAAPPLVGLIMDALQTPQTGAAPRGSKGAGRLTLCKLNFLTPHHR